MAQQFFRVNYENDFLRETSFRYEMLESHLLIYVTETFYIFL